MPVLVQLEDASTEGSHDMITAERALNTDRTKSKKWSISVDASTPRHAVNDPLDRPPPPGGTEGAKDLLVEEGTPPSLPPLPLLPPSVGDADKAVMMRRITVKTPASCSTIASRGR
jgi:hypothetical protein